MKLISLKKPAIVIVGLLLINSLSAQIPQLNCRYSDPATHERDRNIDVSYMKLDVSFNTDSSLVMGKVTHTFKCLQKQVDTIFLDGPGIEIKSVLLDNISVEFKTIADGVVVSFKPALTWDKVYNLTLTYLARPKKGIYFIGWKLPPAAEPAEMTRKQIWTQGQGIDNRHWIPMIDAMSDKFITDLSITFDKNYQVLANGNLKKVTEDKSTVRKIWNYVMPKQHSGYLVMMAIGNYAVKKTVTKSGVPIQFWYYPEHPEKLEPSSKYSEEIIEFLENETGVKYQWGAYSQVMVQEFMYGAMENTSATVFGDFFWVDQRAFLDGNYIGVNAHEATHQWFGDLITARNGADNWLQESFATFYPKLFFGKIKGSDEMKWIQRGEQNAALAAGEKDQFAVRSGMGGTSRVYPKGSAVLSMMKYVLGDDAFKRSITYYLNKNAFKNVETNDLWQSVMDVTGVNLDWFFEEWLYKGGEPHYKINWQNVSDATEVNVEQIHRMDAVTGLFKMPVNIAVYYSDGSVDRKQAIIEKVSQTVTIPNAGKQVLFVLFDENSEIIKKVTFNKTFNELKMQFSKASFMIDRYDALMALKSFPYSDREALLQEALKTETHWAMRAEIVRQLIPFANTNMLETFAKDPMVQVRSVVAENIELNEANEIILSSMLKDSSYKIIENALTRLMDFQTSSPKRTFYLEQCKGINGMQHALKIKWLEYAVEQFVDMAPSFYTMLDNYAGPEYEFRTRVNAFNALKRLNRMNEIIAANLFEASLSFNGRLAGPAKETIAYFKQQSRAKSIFKSTLKKFNCSAADKKILESLF